MLKIGITGGIGSGKSTVCKIFRSLKVPIYHADLRAKDLIHQNKKIRENIIAEFGTNSFVKGVYNTEFISDVVFQNREKLQKLNSIIHPSVIRDFIEWSSSFSNFKYVLQEAAILFESGADKDLDYVIVVDSPLDLRIERLAIRDGISEESVKKRMKTQWPAEKIRQLADWIIDNDEKHLILPQVLSIHDQLIS